ncbi:unnamed protein product [Colias eurytheme]|nr:unnamed protein product [Colias eurytheme]
MPLLSRKSDHVPNTINTDRPKQILAQPHKVEGVLACKNKGSHIDATLASREAWHINNVSRMQSPFKKT